MKHTRWIASLIVAALMLLLGAGPAAAQSGNTNAVLNQHYVLGQGETLGQDLMVLGGSVRLERASLVKGNVVVAGASVYIDGQVEGDVVVLGGDTELDAEAVVEGDLVVFGQLHRAESSQVLGNTVEGVQAGRGLKYLPQMLSALSGVGRSAVEPADLPVSGHTSWLSSLTGIILTLVVAVLVVALIPERLERTVRAMREAAPVCLGVGLLTLVLCAILVPLLVIICVGIPVAIVLALAVLLASLMGWVAASHIVGRRLLLMLKVKASATGETLAGAGLLWLLSNIPCLGGLIALLVVCWGLGAVVLTRFGTLVYSATSSRTVIVAPSVATGAPVAPVAPAAPEPPAPPASKDTKPLDPTLVEPGPDDSKN